MGPPSAAAQPIQWINGSARAQQNAAGTTSPVATPRRQIAVTCCFAPRCRRKLADQLHAPSPSRGFRHCCTLSRLIADVVEGIREGSGCMESDFISEAMSLVGSCQGASPCCSLENWGLELGWGPSLACAGERAAASGGLASGSRCAWVIPRTAPSALRVPPVTACIGRGAINLRLRFPQDSETKQTPRRRAACLPVCQSSALWPSLRFPSMRA